MRFQKRTYIAVLAVLVASLLGLLIYDVYDDWIVRGFGVEAALLENILPLLVVCVLGYGIYWLHTSGSAKFAATMTQWTVIGLVTIAVLGGWITTIQVLEQEFQPLIVLTHTAIGGALIGMVIGYTSGHRQQAQVAVETEKQRFESLFENSPTAIVDLASVDGDLQIERSNDEFESVAGETDVSNERLFDIVPLVDRETERELRHRVTAGEIYETEVTVRDPEPKYYKLRVAPYAVGKAGNRAFAIYTDVTDLRETKSELEETVAQLEQSNDRLQQFAYIASHDLQEPLRMVSSYMTLLEDEYEDNLDEEAMEYIEFAVDGAERMQEMVDGLLEYSRVQTEGEEFTETDTESVLDAALTSLQLRIEDSGANVTSDDLPVVHADETQLRQLFQNLVENAIDHGGDAPSIHVSSEHRNGDVVFSVHDDGPGIPERQQDRVFELFKKGASEDSGTGIGLAICDRIVSRHGGEIWVESTDGEGTTFHFSVPA